MNTAAEPTPPAAGAHAPADDTPPALLHELGAQRFSQHIGEHRCVLDYQLDGSTVTFTHTGVPDALRGQGLAAQLVEAGLAWARAEGLHVVPACSYVRVYMQRHPETRDLLAH
jgi:uncharacterized protein